MTREQFIKRISPIAVQLRAEGSPIFPSVRIAQSILETGGTINPWNNLVGYKVGAGAITPYWQGKSVRKLTWEVYDGTRQDRVPADFRAYDSIEDGYRDQDLLFEKDRYRRVREAENPEEQADMLYMSGYATDPNYAVKLKMLMASYGLGRYDEEAVQLRKEWQERLQQLEQRKQALQARLQTLRQAMAMTEIPEWAKEAVERAVQFRLIDTPLNGSYDFYRLLTILKRRGVI